MEQRTVTVASVTLGADDDRTGPAVDELAALLAKDLDAAPDPA